MDFYFILGSDLVPGLVKWDGGQKFLDEVKFIIFERKGYEHILDPSTKKDYSMPKYYEKIKADENLIGMISSTLVRQRIKHAKDKLKT